MHTEIRAHHAMASRDILASLALQRASIMHLVDLKRGCYSPSAQNCGLTVAPIGRSAAVTSIFMFHELPPNLHRIRLPRIRPGC